MGRRRKAREMVLQALYEAEFSSDGKEHVIERQIDQRESNLETAAYARQLYGSVLAHREELDAMIESGLDNWEMDRVALVDKNILRFGLAEVLYFPDVPSKVIINEAIEIAHRYSSADAGRFVNGLLDRFIRQHRKGVV